VLSNYEKKLQFGTEFSGGPSEVLAGKPFRGVNFCPMCPLAVRICSGYLTPGLDWAALIPPRFQGIDLWAGRRNFFDPHCLTAAHRKRCACFASGQRRQSRTRGGAAGAHTDYGNVTPPCWANDKVAGLQVATARTNGIGGKRPHVPGGAFVLWQYR